MPISGPAKLLTRPQLVRAAKHWRAAGLGIVFTNGVFDILHRGHVELLEEARRLGDVLVVGLNSDASTRRLKGFRRPFNPARDRAIVMSALRAVDAVTVFPEDTPLKLIQALRPDVLVKGAEYGTGEIVGEAEVRSWGGKVKRFRMRRGYSTTNVIGKLDRAG